ITPLPVVSLPSVKSPELCLLPRLQDERLASHVAFDVDTETLKKRDNLIRHNGMEPLPRRGGRVRVVTGDDPARNGGAPCLPCGGHSESRNSLSGSAFSSGGGACTCPRPVGDTPNILMAWAIR